MCEAVHVNTLAGVAIVREAGLPDCNVFVEFAHSTVNYMDATTE